MRRAIPLVLILAATAVLALAMAAFVGGAWA